MKGLFSYYSIVGVRRVRRRAERGGRRSGASVFIIFWLVFFSCVGGIFIINRETIRRNFNLLTERLSSSPDLAERRPENNIFQEPPPGIIQVPQEPDEIVITGEAEYEPAGITQQERPPLQAEIREQHIYFTQVERDGQILPSRVSRNLEVSNSPMQDALNALLAGPSAEELDRGIISLIPENTRILSAFVRGNTAYISFSDDFKFNTYGVEGYTAQVREVVRTVTEFPTVRDVQILIEGRRIDFIGEGIWIGSPIDRQAF